MFAGMSFAANKWDFGGAFSTNSYTSQPILVVNIDNKYDVVVGYQTIPGASGQDATSSILLGGTMWTFKTGAINCGWSLYYLSSVFADPGDDNKLTALSGAFTVKTQLVQDVTLRADAILLSSTSGKVNANDYAGTAISPSLQLSLLFNFM